MLWGLTKVYDESGAWCQSSLHWLVQIRSARCTKQLANTWHIMYMLLWLSRVFTIHVMTFCPIRLSWALMNVQYIRVFIQIAIFLVEMSKLLSKNQLGTRINHHPEKWIGLKCFYHRENRNYYVKILPTGNFCKTWAVCPISDFYFHREPAAIWDSSRPIVIGQARWSRG